MGFGSPLSVTRYVVARVLGTSPRYMLHIIQLVGSWKNVRPRFNVGHCMTLESAVRHASTAGVCHRTGGGCRLLVFFDHCSLRFLLYVAVTIWPHWCTH